MENSVKNHKKILLLCASSDMVIKFRFSFIQMLLGNGFDVSVIAFDNKNQKPLEEAGVKFYWSPCCNRSINPIKLISIRKQYKRLICLIAPDIVCTYMLKPNIYGTLAAKKAGVKDIFCMVEGAGDVFINEGIKWKLIRAYVCYMYKKAFCHAKKVIFLNEEDKEEFLRRCLVKAAQCEIVHGIGVDLEKFTHKPPKNRFVFLMVARMLKTKGVSEYCACARLVRQEYPKAVFRYLGTEGPLKIADIRQYIEDGSIQYLGTTDDARPFYEDCSVVVLPSYREGFPVSVMEANATGRAAIVSDAIGCRDTVRDGYNGFLTEKHNIGQLAEKVVWCIEHPEAVEQMGRNARKFAEERFDVRDINRRLLEIISSASEDNHAV